MNHCACEDETPDLSLIDDVLERYRGQKGAIIPILQKAQATYGYLPRPVMRYIAEKTNTPLHQVFGVATFYSQFFLNRRGKYIIEQCDGTACHVRGSGKIIDAVQTELGLSPGETTEDYKYTYEVVYCLGSCGLAPVAVINDKVIGRLKPRDLIDHVKELE
ncbi:MAG: NAD(P)H-dependent oxidoreductase subunit E [Armatimonadetes bacterium]|nr:NAD(P)H-dependent oxidoreductase subunit E [Armatimonadota bacterium]